MRLRDSHALNDSDVSEVALRRFHEYQFEYRSVKFMTRLGAVYEALKFTSKFLIRPYSCGPELGACMRGVRDGLIGRIDHRF
jgi:hypothetical protein